MTNPSVELATTGYTAVGGSISQSTVKQYHGAYSLAVAPGAGVTDGVYYGTVSLTSGTTYAASCKVWGIAGRKYKLSFATTGGADLSAYRFIATGRWQWVWVYWTETSSTTRRIYVTKDTSSNTNVFYIDGVQVEAITAGETVSTYIDGDQQGLLPRQFPYPYQWTGTPHASTSTRLATTRAGGMVVNLDRFRYRVLAYTGLGLTAVANIASVPAAADGATYQATIARPRSFAISGFFDGRDLTMLDQARSDLYSVLGPDGAVPRQPARLVYQALDGQDARSQIGTITAAYERGLEGATTNMHRETAPITFTAYLPTVQTGEAGAAFAETTSTLTDADFILQRSAAGQWAAMGSGGAGATFGVNAIATGPDGTIYAGGDFTSMGGVANTDGIAKWDGSAWTAMGTGISGGTNTVYAIAARPDGSIYVGGAFTAMGGVANTSRIAKWDGANWTALSTGANGAVRALALGADGNLYAGGDFTTIGGVAIDRIAKWDGSAWSALAVAGAGATVAALVLGKDGDLYAAGNFTTIGGVTANEVARWDGTAWNAMASGLSVARGVNALAVGPNGAIYAGGNFAIASGDAIDYAAVWNGTAWTQLGTLNGLVSAMTVAPDGVLWAGGAFTVADGITLRDNFARWTGSGWAPPDVILPGSVTIYSLYATPDGRIFIGYDTSGTAAAPTVTSVTNAGTARTYPTITTIAYTAGTAALYQVWNVRTGKAIYLAYTITAGEVVTIRCSPMSTTMTSSFRGDVTSAILPGSSPDFALEPGANPISLMVQKTTAVMRWPVAYQSLSDLTD